MPHPTINDVASAAGVSKGAVSFALNGRAGLAPATRQRILDTAEQLGWTPSPRARALSVSRALAVGLVVARAPEVLRADAFFPSFIAGLETVLSERGHALMLQVAQDDDRATYRRLAAERRVDGVFVTDLQVADPRPELLRGLRLPFVVVGPDLDPANGPAVGLDDAPGIRAAVDHLVALGHRRIAHVAGPQQMVHGRSRRDAWAAGLQAAGLPEGPCVEADFSAESGATAMHTLLDLAEPPTAVVFANDLMAMAGLSVALSRGTDVPGALSVTGYDDMELAAHLQPALTTVTTDVVAWGRAAAARLLEVIDEAAPSATRPPAHPLPEPRLVVRASTGPAPTL